MNQGPPKHKAVVTFGQQQ